MNPLYLAMALSVLAAGCSRTDEPVESWQSQRDRMMQFDIEGRGVKDPAVLQAMRTVPRHEFVPEELRNLAYQDRPLPIGMDQTISQPYIVAAMTELVRPAPGNKILEVGTGSGYQAAILATIVDHVYTIEIVPALAESAMTRLARLGYTNVTVRAGDGYVGWPEQEPFDGIVVTCGAEEVPGPLIQQLKRGGRMVIPVGPSGHTQSLRLIEKDALGRIREEDVMPVSFVPLTGEHGRPR